METYCNVPRRATCSEPIGKPLVNMRFQALRTVIVNMRFQALRTVIVKIWWKGVGYT